MNLHNEIMNLPARPIAADEYDHKLMAYKCGHRDARHDAAELCLKYSKYIDTLEKELLNCTDDDDPEELIIELREVCGL